MSVEKHMAGYAGETIGNYIHEAALLRSKCAFLESVVERQKQEIEQLKSKVGEAKPEHYINQEPTL